MAFAINPPKSAIIDSRGLCSPEWYRFFANVQRVIGDDALRAMQQAPILTWGTTAAFGNERVLTGGAGIDLVSADPALEVSLSASGVTAGTYGDQSHLVSITVDEFGRVLSVSQDELNSDNVSEGVSNLFFTDGRARAALNGGNGVDYNALSGEIAADEPWFDDRYVQTDQGAPWAAPTGTADRSAFATYSAPTISNPPTQIEVQAIADHLQVLSSHLKALIDDLRANRALND